MTAEGGYGMRTAVYALFTRWSMFFAVVTLASSALQLVQGDDADTNSHILNRAAICLIVAFMTIILERLRLKSRVLSALAGYLLTMAAAFAYVGLVSLFDPVTPHSLFMFFWNFTAIAVIYIAIEETVDWHRRRRTRQKEQS